MAARTKKTGVEKLPAGPAARVEIRYDGRVRFAAMCWDTRLFCDEEAGEVAFTAVLKQPPVEAPPEPTHKFGDDVRDGETVIHQVHSGRRT